MKSPVGHEAKRYAIDVIKTIKAIKESGCDIDYPLEQFMCASTRIGVAIARYEHSVNQEEVLESYKEANRYASASLYWLEILEEINNYDQIPYEPFKKQCKSILSMINDGVKLIENLLGRRHF